MRLLAFLSSLMVFVVEDDQVLFGSPNAFQAFRRIIAVLSMRFLEAFSCLRSSHATLCVLKAVLIGLFCQIRC